jgi:hypothetical protein
MSKAKDIEALIAFQTTALTTTAALLVLASGDPVRIAKLCARLSTDLAVALIVTDDIIGLGTSAEQTARLQGAVELVREWVPDELAAGDAEVDRMLAEARATMTALNPEKSS